MSMKTIIKTDKAPMPIGPYNQAILVNDTLYASGQIAINPATNEIISGNIEEETKQVMENLAAVLDAAGMRFSDVVKCSIFISDMNDFAAINNVYVLFLTMIMHQQEKPLKLPYCQSE
jgi:2-iminobutanoate/2-iminopropanoate deaminase